jgi:hypothetical protein
MKKASFVLFVVMMIAFHACKKDDKKPEPAVPVMTLHFTDRFVHEQLPVIVFLSDQSGKTILDTSCVSDGTYELYAKEGLIVPEKMMLTVVSSEPYWHSLRVHINTYTEVEKGSDWTLQGSRRDTIATAHVSLENVPDLSGPILYATPGYYMLTFNKTNRALPTYDSPADLYVKVRTDTGQYFRYIPEYLSFGSFTADMSVALPTESRSVNFPMQVENYEAKIFGYKESDLNSPVPLILDYLLSDGFITDSIQLNYPPDLFTYYQTQIMLQETYLSDISWFQNTEGEIPSEFVKVDADILSMLPDQNKLNVESNGTFDMVTADWQFVDYALMHYEWKVFASDTSKTLLLPEITAAFQSMYPTISHDSLSFQYTELTDFQQIDSYKALLGKMFDTDIPIRMDRLDAHIIRKSLPLSLRKQ